MRELVKPSGSGFRLAVRHAQMLLVFLAMILLAPAAEGALPRPQGHVNDFAGILAADAQLEAMLADIEQNTTAEVAVVTVQTTGSLDPKTYATDLFNDWGIGKKNDNGLLIFIAVQERRIEVETGYGVEGILPDGKVGALLDTYAVPALKAGDYDAAVLDLVGAVGDVLRGDAEDIEAPGEPLLELIPAVLPIALLVLIFIAIIAAARLGAPKCGQDGKRMAVKRVEPMLGGMEVVTYTCPKCGRTKTVRRARTVVAPILIGGRGGSSGGGFGGGSSGGGGAGRGF